MSTLREIGEEVFFVKRYGSDSVIRRGTVVSVHVAQDKNNPGDVFIQYTVKGEGWQFMLTEYEVYSNQMKALKSVTKELLA